jgi:transposase-like protein
VKTVEDKEKFIELRAGGMSFAKIAQTIGVSKPTLIKWHLEFNKEIENRRFLAIEEVIELYKLMQKSRIEIFSEMLSKALNELRGRDFRTLSMKELLILINQLEGKLLRESSAVRYTTDQQVSFWASAGEDDGLVQLALFDRK